MFWSSGKETFSGHNSDTNEAFVLTQRQKMLKDAQERADALIDRENTLALKSLSKKELKENGLEQGDLRRLFEEKELVQEEIDEKSANTHTEEAMHESELPINIVDRNRNQVTEDQISDVTLDKVQREASEKGPVESDGYLICNGILKHRKFLDTKHNGTRYVDRIVVPESYRNEILRVGHAIPLSGHMGNAKTLDRIAAHFFWPGLSSDVR